MSDLSRFSKRSWLILILFGLLGQIAWSVENMYFNVFVFEKISENLDAITLMVQLSGVTATVVTLIAGVLSDKLGDRRRFISIGYIIWGVTVALFGFISTDLVGSIFGVSGDEAVKLTLGIVIAADCVMTLFGSTANDAAFNAWVTDNTEQAYRGRIESIISILPLASMLIVAGGFGIIKDIVGYEGLFAGLGALIIACGVVGIFIVRDADTLEKNGGMKDIFYGFRPSVVRDYLPLYVALLIILVYSIATQVFMPYMIIYMSKYLEFTTVEYSIVFGLAIALGAALNVYLGRLSDRMDKVNLIYVGGAAMATGLFGMYIARGLGKIGNLIAFGIAGFIMISGFIFIAALCGSLVRDYTPKDSAGKLQGVRMVFSVLIPMLAGPAIGNAINKSMNIPLENAGADAMTTQYIPAPEIYLAASLILLLVIALVPLLRYVTRRRSVQNKSVGI